MDFGRKRGRPDATFPGNVGVKKSKNELDSFTTGVGSKSKPCTKFFSTSGCSFGENCHFEHYFPGYNAHTQLANSSGGNNNTANPVARNTAFTDGPSTTKIPKLCNKINTPEGCRFGDKCRFAHSEVEMEIGSSKPRSYNPGGYEPTQHGLPPVGNFGLETTAKISVDASCAGPIIGKHGVNTKQICRQTGVRLSIKDHDTDPNLKNIELGGTLDQIKEATSMVHELIMNLGVVNGRVEQNTGSLGRGGSQSKYQRKKMCEKFPKGLCTFGERCRFAHS